jgi:hypothetical protein
MTRGRFGSASKHFLRRLGTGHSFGTGRRYLSGNQRRSAGSRSVKAKINPDFDSVDFFSRVGISLLPFILLAVNDNWIFSVTNNVDSWIYSGFHLHLPEFLKAFGGTYYASRLPWTVTGWLLHLAFDDLYALYILHFAVFYLAVFSLYIAVRTIFANTAAAGAAALLLGTHTYFLYAAGSDYVDGVSIAYLLAATAALANAAVRPRWRLATVLWGVATCAVVSNYILLVLFVPIQVGLFLLLNRMHGKRPVLWAAVLFAAGAVGAMLFLGATNWLLGGPFLYIFNQIKVLFTLAHDRFIYTFPLVEWAPKAFWLIGPAITFAFSCVYVGLHFKSAAKSVRVGASGTNPEISLFFCCLAVAAASLIFIGLQADHFYVLEMEYNADALLPFSYLAIGGAFAAMIKPCGRARQLTFLAAAALIGLIPWLLATFGYVFPSWELFKGLKFEIAWVMAGSILLLLFVRWSYRAWGAVLTVLFFSIVNLGAPQGRIDYPPNPIFKSEILAVFDASRAVGRYNPDARARFWFSRNTLLRSVVSTYLYEYSLLNENFPRLLAADGRQSVVAPGDRVILMTAGNDDPMALANAAASDRGLHFKGVANIPIRRPGVAFDIFVADVELDLSKYGPIVSPQPFATGLPSRIVTPPQPWAYGLQIPLTVQDLQGPLWIRIRIKVSSGPVGVGILNHEGSEFLSRIPVSAGGETAVMLGVPKIQQIGDLVIQSWEQGYAADVTIGEITVLKLRSTIEGSFGKERTISVQ